MTEQPREIIWREARGGDGPPRPESPAQARARLDQGNADFAAIGEHGGRQVIEVGPEAFGLPDTDGELRQEPFAAVLACSDARAPVELVFNQAGNSVFVVRVAGGVPGRECVGSLNYAVANLPTVKVIAVLGHSQCGAVSAAVDALAAPQTYLELAHDPALRAVVDALLAGVRMADIALREVHGDAVRAEPGYRDALIDVSVLCNAAVTASLLSGQIECEVAFGVFDLGRRSVGTPGADRWRPGLADAPADGDALQQVLEQAARAQTF